MSPRPLALVCGLTACDYFVWNWSLSHNQDVLALVSGLTLPPLVAACVLMLAVSAGRLLARAAQRSAGATASDGASARRRVARQRANLRRRESPLHGAASARLGDAPVMSDSDTAPSPAGRSSDRSSRKLAA